MDAVKKYDPIEHLSMGGTCRGQMEENEYGEWVSEESYDRACEAINGMVTRIDQYVKRIGELERDMDAIASLYERDVDRVGSYEMVQIAYDMRCIARSALTEHTKP
jgi:hypothetical protein